MVGTAVPVSVYILYRTYIPECNVLVRVEYLVSVEKILNYFFGSGSIDTCPAFRKF